MFHIWDVGSGTPSLMLRIWCIGSETPSLMFHTWDIGGGTPSEDSFPIFTHIICQTCYLVNSNIWNEGLENRCFCAAHRKAYLNPTMLSYIGKRYAYAVLEAAPS